MEYHSENFGGTYEFRCKKHTEDFIVNAHLHDYSEILYIEKGCADIIIQNKSYTIPEKHLVFIPPNYVHKFSCKNTVAVCAVFSNDFIPLFFNEIGDRFLVCEPIDFSEKQYIVDNLYRLDKSNRLLISGRLYLICDDVIKKSSFYNSQPMDSTLYQKILLYLEHHFSEEITLKSVAKKFGYNEKYLSSRIHTLTGLHFKKLLSTYRINYAKQLLNDKNVKISEVAFLSGFSAINTFNRVFKDFVGITPREYREHRKDPLQ